MRLDKVFDRLIEELLEESAKTDFVAKFGDKALNDFDKAKDRLRNKGMSVDYGQYLKMTPKELQDTILSLYDDKKDSQKKRVIQGTDKEIRGKYKYLGEKDGYKVYQPLDVQASMDLGVNTGWCTAGRYGHAGHPDYTPSYEDAKSHWDDYTSKGVEFYYFLDSETMYGKYAIAFYPRVLDVTRECGIYYIKETNVEIYNAQDNFDYSSIKKLPTNLIPREIVLEYEELPEFSINKDGVLIKYRGNSKKVIIPNSVKSIGLLAFYGNENITSVKIPDGVKKIEDGAFSKCINLANISIPNSVTNIEYSAFSGCSSLTSITIPKSVTNIESRAFSCCENLTSINIPNGVDVIENYIFEYCESLTSIKIPNSVKNIGCKAFNRCKSLASVTIPNSVTNIGERAFEECESLTNVVIPHSVQQLGAGMFASCNKLTTVDMKCKVKTIPYGAFWGCRGLTNIVIPMGVEQIREYAFAHCSSLTGITIPNSVTYIDSSAFNECESLVVKTNNKYAINYCKAHNIKYIE